MNTKNPNGKLLRQAIAVRDLLKDPNKWAQKNLAEDDNGCEVDPHNKNACKFCLIGGIDAIVTPKNSREDPYDAVQKHPLGILVAHIIGGTAGDDDVYLHETMYEFNDNHTHQEVMEILETTISYIEGASSAGMVIK